MRVTGGKYRNKPIEAREARTLRPTSSRIREAIFNILQHGRFLNSEDYVEDDNPSRIEGRKAIDIFCGTGALGIEALSRGVEHVTFIDQDPITMKLARQNVGALGETPNTNFLRSDSTNLPTARQRHDLVLMDPPYKQNLTVPALKTLRDNGWLADGAILIVEHGKPDEFTPPEGYTELDSRIYDRTRLTVLQYKET